MLAAICDRWWVLMIRGMCAVLFGAIAFASPGITLWALIILYALFALADGIGGVMLGIKGGADGRTWWEMILLGLLGIVAAIVAFSWPGLTAVVLLYVIGFWAIVRGVLEISGAIKLRKVIDHEWWLILSGLLSVLFGAFLFARPGAGALALVLVIGGYMVMMGILMIALALRLRGLRGKLATS
ncbi:MAG TPA: DUF308 domain-containing protein [Candidatus Polarisedimenticolia bacterium]|nr:DUF308 domain-containing protein [Candidatus Polarisedimenticolia bacterium]